MDLKKFVVGDLRREVSFVVDEDVVRVATKEEEADEYFVPVFVLDLEYISPERMKELAERAMTRKVTNVRRARKGFSADRGEVLTTVAKAAVKKWIGMTGEAARALQLRLDFKQAGIGLNDEIEFTAQNLDVFLSHSDLETIIYTVLNDYEFWFPDDEEQSGNSPSGQSGSTGDSPATPASNSTSGDTSP